jgi:hypothetical protein
MVRLLGSPARCVQGSDESPPLLFIATCSELKF